MNTDEIRPALTPEQWANRDYERSAFGVVGDLNPETLFASMALENDALPDDDPRKITRAMVARINEAAKAIEREWGDPPIGAAVRNFPLAELRRDAAKLAALLPPE